MVPCFVRERVLSRYLWLQSSSFSVGFAPPLAYDLWTLGARGYSMPLTHKFDPAIRHFGIQWGQQCHQLPSAIPLGISQLVQDCLFVQSGQAYIAANPQIWGRAPIHHLGTRWVGDGHTNADVGLAWSRSSLPRVTLKTTPILIWLNADHSQTQGMEWQPLPFSTPLFFRQSVLWCCGQSLFRDRLTGQVVKASALGVDFSGSSHTSDLKIGTPVATLPGAWHYRVSSGTGQPGVSILWLGEVESLIWNLYLSVAACNIVSAHPSLRYTSMLLGH